MTRYMPGAPMPPPPTIPGPPALPYPFPPAPPGPGGRVWTSVLAAGTAGAVVAATIAALITGSVRSTAAPAPKTPPAVTVTVAPPSPAPLPVDQADRHTCNQGLLASVVYVRAANREFEKALPNGVKVTDPEVRANPEWAAAVRRAAADWRLAADTLESNIAPGTTPILAAAAETTVKASRARATAYATFDAAGGNAGDIATKTADEMVVLCKRLAP